MRHPRWSLQCVAGHCYYLGPHLVGKKNSAWRRRKKVWKSVSTMASYACERDHWRLTQTAWTKKYVLKNGQLRLWTSPWVANANCQYQFIVKYSQNFWEVLIINYWSRHMYWPVTIVITGFWSRRLACSTRSSDGSEAGLCFLWLISFFFLSMSIAFHPLRGYSGSWNLVFPHILA